MTNPEMIYGGIAKREDGNILSFDSLEKTIGHHFHDATLLRQALTHRSYVNETGEGREASNERLEFLGDAVLELISSEKLYREKPDEPEGKLSKLRSAHVCESALSRKAAQIRLGEYLFLGKGEEKTGGRAKASVTSDALEALIGAIYLDGGMEAAGSFINQYVLDDLLAQGDSDYKTKLQETIQRSGIAEVSYRLVEESGPDHDKCFVMAAVIDGKEYARGKGKSKKAAEQMAARDALDEIIRQQEQE